MKSRPLFVSPAAFALAALFLVGSAFAGEKLEPGGTWTWVREFEGLTSRSVLKLSFKNGKLAGTYRRLGQEVPDLEREMAQDAISFEAEGKWDDQKIHAKFQGTLVQNTIKGAIDLTIGEGSLTLDWIAKRGVDPNDVLGNWKLKVVTRDGKTFEPSLKLSADGDDLKGTYVSQFGEHAANEIKLDGPMLSWTVNAEHDGQKFKAIYKGTPVGNAIKGTLDYDFDGQVGSLDFSGERIVEKKDSKTGTGNQENRPVPKAGATPGGENSTNQSAPQRRAIVSLKSRQEIVVIYVLAGKSPTFSVLSSDGKQTLAKDISLKDLQAGYPQIYESYRRSLVNAWADR